MLSSYVLYSNVREVICRSVEHVKYDRHCNALCKLPLPMHTIGAIWGSAGNTQRVGIMKETYVTPSMQGREVTNGEEANPKWEQVYGRKGSTEED